MNTSAAVTPNGPPRSPFIHVVPPQDLVEGAPPLESVSVPMADLIKEEAPVNKTISFKKSSSLGEHIALPTTKEAPPLIAIQSPNQTSEELRAQMIGEEMEPVDQMSPQDFEMIAGFMIDAFDIGTVTLFRMYALDTSDAPYEMKVDKKNKLKKLLGLLLVRFNKKFPIGILFIFTLVLTMITPAMKAHAHRKEVKALNPKKTGPKKGSKNEPKPKIKADAPKPKAPPADAAKAVIAPPSPPGVPPGIVNPNKIVVIPKKKQGAQPK